MTGGVVGLGVGHVTGEGVADPEVGLTIDDVGGVDHTVRGVVTQGQSPERGVGDNQEACLEIGERAKVKLPTPVEMLNTGAEIPRTIAKKRKEKRALFLRKFLVMPA